MNKISRFLKALWDEGLKRLPYITALVIVLYFASTYVNYQHINRNTESLRDLGNKISNQQQEIKKQGQQIKDLAKQNNDLAKENQFYQKCNFLAFARFTRTFTPVQDDEINSCIPSPQTSVTSQSLKTNQTTVPNSQAQSPSSPSLSPSTSSPSTSSSQPKSSQPGLLKQITNLLGL